jgi:hypothetical protein
MKALSEAHEMARWGCWADLAQLYALSTQFFTASHVALSHITDGITSCAST